MLAKKRVVITGASKGIGAEIARAFAQAGAEVIVSARKQEELVSVAEQISAEGGVVHPIPCDVTNPDAVALLRDAVLERMGGIDILINNAGVGGSHRFIDHPDELWHSVLATNLTGVYYVSKAFVKPMVEQRWGRIIMIASTAAKVGSPYIAAYAAAKHGVLGLTRVLAAELVTSGVTVNAICPGYVDTPMTHQTVANIAERTKSTPDKARELLMQMNPQHRLIEPEEVASLAVFLSLESSKGINGQGINVDGGAVKF